MIGQTPKPSKVLLIDDDILVRQLSRDYLEANGISVLTAADGLEGLTQFRKHRSEIALVVLDMVMPKISGRDCWLQLREMDPSVKVLVTTGCSLNTELEACIREGVLGYLFKPYRPSQLLACLRNNL